MSPYQDVGSLGIQGFQSSNQSPRGPIVGKVWARPNRKITWENYRGAIRKMKLIEVAWGAIESKKNAVHHCSKGSLGNAKALERLKSQ